MDPAIVGFLMVLGSFAGGYFGSYFKKKGENKALQEDIAALTRTTKQIEAKISNEVWDRQKQWELKREVLFEATRRLADVEDGLLSLDTVMQVERAEQKEGEITWKAAKHERIMKWRKASAAFDETRMLVEMACEKETIAAFESFGTFVNVIAAKISPGKDLEIYLKSLPERDRKRREVRTAVRKELGLLPS